MASYFHDNEDLRFYFDRGIDWAPLVEVTEYGFRTKDGYKTAGEALTFYREVAQLVGKLAAEEVAPQAAQIDRDGTHLSAGEAVVSPAMSRLFERIKALELHRLCIPRELGGLNAPLLLYFLNAEMLARADVSVMTHHSFHGGMAMAMLAYSIHEGTTTFDKDNACLANTRFGRAIEEIAAGDAWGCMDITEPGAGSDMAALRTVAELGADGVWYVTGQKIFISSGHAKYHFVIARTEKSSSPEDPRAGLGGLSMFLCQSYEDLPDGKRRRFVTIDRVEEKLGHHGSVTAALSFDRSPAQLIGQRGEGFRYMLTLMNNARLGVGFECLGLCEAAHRMAAAYAQDRVSMGKPIAHHELLADYLDEMRTDIQGVRALAMHGAFHEEMAQKLNMMLQVAGGFGESEKLGQRLVFHRAQARRATPLLKYLAAEKAVELARRCIQIHGGVGYTRDFGAEKLLRDAVVMPIYEGTSQIQALMAMKDTLLGIIRRPQEFLTRAAQARWRSMSARDELDRRVARMQSLAASAQQHLLTRTAAGKLRALSEVAIGDWPGALRRSWDPKRDFALALLHAERLTRLLADQHIAELLLAQAQAHPERRELAVRWLERAEPRCRLLHEEITTTGDRLLKSLAETQGAARAAV